MNKKKNKKLTLSAETLRNLSESDLHEAAGAATANPRCNTTACTATHACSGCAPCA